MGFFLKQFKKGSFFQKVFEVSNRPIIISSLEGKYLFVNDIYIEMRRCTRESLLNKYWWETFSSGELARRVKNTHVEILKKGECSYNAGYNIGIEDALTIEWQSKIIYSDEFKSDVIVEYGKDVSEKMKLKTQLIRMKKLDNLGTLSGGIAREYNNIHTGILKHLSSLKNESKQTEEQLNLLEKTQYLSLDALKLTSKLLSFTKKNMCSDQLLDPNSIVKDVYEIIRKTISWKINVNKIITETKSFILGDYDQIFQSIMNLVMNSTDSMKDEGELFLSTYITVFSDDTEFRDEGFIIKRGEYFAISVKDSGHGMDEKTKKRIIEPYFTTKKDASNEGIGMSLVYCVLKSHNGYLFIKSKKNVSTTVTLLFPVAIKKNTSALKKIPVLFSATKIRNDVNILLAYNDKDLRCMEKILTKYGYNIKTVSKLEEALKICSSESIDLIILDINLIKPFNDNNISTIKKKSTEIIALTDSINIEKLDKLNSFRINHIMFKPFKISYLLNLIEDIFKKN